MFGYLNTINKFFTGIFHSKYVFWFTLLCAMIIKYTYYGIKYFPILDDNNIYGFLYNYYSSHDAFVKLATSRPIAYFFDCFIISRLWKQMWIVLVGIILLHWVCCILIYKLFKAINLRIGYFVVLFFALAPFGTEATYWISASSRLVIGLFFALLSMYIMTSCICNDGIKNNRKQTILYLLLFWILNLMSMGFYEQITFFTFLCPLFILIVLIKKIKHKIILIIPFINIFLFAAFYKYFSDVGQIASRGQFLDENYISHTKDVLRSIRHLVVNEQISMYQQGIVRGFNLIIKDGNWPILVLFAVIAIVLSIHCSFRLKVINENYTKSIKKIIIAVFLFIIPFAPFFVLKLIYITNRNAFVSLFAIGLVAEVLLYIILKWDKRRIVIGLISGVMVFLFLLTNTSELQDYRNVSEADQEIVNNLTEAYIQRSDNGKDGTLLFNTKDIYVDVTLKHFSNCTAADWALTGAVQALRSDAHLGVIQPIKKNEKIILPIVPIKKYAFYGIGDSKEVFHLNGTWNGDELLLYKDDGSLFGIVIKDNNGSQIFKVIK